jgi:hypothetical protein
MVFYSRWGILGLLIPCAIIVAAMIVSESFSNKPLNRENQKSTFQDLEVDQEDSEEAITDKLKRIREERQRSAEILEAEKNAKGTGYLIGGLLSAAVLWPLGRWMNKRETCAMVDQQTGQLVEAQFKGGHTMFFIPLEYWGFIWAVIGVFKFF